MPGKLLISTAYLPPVEYFALIQDADEVLVEREENYLKQTYRNRCYLLSANGTHHLIVPVYLGSIHKTPVKDIRIDYSKRWQQVHLRAMTTSYSAAPFFEYYFEEIEKSILRNYEFLIDLNSSLTESILRILGIDRSFSFTSCFIPAGSVGYDHRYSFTPKIKSGFINKEYTRVFSHDPGSQHALSIIDLIFNMGPESVHFLQKKM